MGTLITFSITNDEEMDVEKFSDNEDIDRYEEVNIIYKSIDKEYILYENDFR